MPPPAAAITKGHRPEPEWEIRLLSFSMGDVLRRARDLGAKRAVRTLLVNSMFRMPGRDDLHIRLRRVVTARKVTAFLTLKMPGGRFELESESEVADAVQAETMLAMMGCVRVHTMEKFRDVIDVPGMGEIALDSHPGLPPLLEVECATERKLHILVKKLGLAMPPPGALPSPQQLYAELYGVSDARDRSGDLTFANPSNIPEHVTKNRRRFEQRLRAQRAEAQALMRRHGMDSKLAIP